MNITRKPKPTFPLQERGLLHYMQDHCDDAGLFNQPQQMIADELETSRPFVNKWAKMLVKSKRIALYEPARCMEGRPTIYRVTTPVTQVTGVTTSTPLSRVTVKPDSIDSVSVRKTVCETTNCISMGINGGPTCHLGDM